MLMIIMDCDGRMTLEENFAIVELYDRTMCQDDAINLVPLLMNSNKDRGGLDLVLLVLWVVKPKNNCHLK